MFTKIAANCCVLLLSLISITANAQSWKVRSQSAGYRIFETNTVGNNPFTIAPLLKDPAPYERYLSTINYNSIWGNPGVTQLHTFYLNAEWRNDEPLLRFWKKYTLQAGLLLTTRITGEAGAVGYESHLSSPDTPIYVKKYSLTRKQQFLGASAGVNRRFPLSKRLTFQTGLHGQGSFALVNHYQQQWDTSTYSSGSGWKHRVTRGENLKGKNFFQWQLMIPLGLEYELYQKRLFIRVEADAGILGNRHTSRSFAALEAHGAGIFLIYQRK